MRLTDLSPRWLNANVFVFKCPHCQKALLSCKNVILSSRELYDLFEATIGDYWNLMVVPCREGFAWTFSGTDFATLTVTPSIDASGSGHWHGNITNGEAL